MECFIYIYIYIYIDRVRLKQTNKKIVQAIQHHFMSKKWSYATLCQTIKILKFAKQFKFPEKVLQVADLLDTEDILYVHIALYYFLDPFGS